MRIELVRGSLTATAESVADIATLMALKGTVRARASVKKRENKKACVLCGKRVKYLQAHTKNNHSTHEG